MQRSPLTSMTVEALKDSGLGKKEAERAKNMFALGLLSWMYHRPTEGTIRFLERKFAGKPEIARREPGGVPRGVELGETTEAFAVSYEVKPAPMPPGRYRNISGNLALSYGLVAAGQLSGLPVFLGAYPITPASGHPARAEQSTRPSASGRSAGGGRDRGHRCRDRCRVRRCALR